MDPDYEAQGSGIVTLDQLRDLYDGYATRARVRGTAWRTENRRWQMKQR